MIAIRVETHPIGVKSDDIYKLVRLYGADGKQSLFKLVYEE